MENVDDILLVSESEILNANDYLFKNCNLRVEPSGAVPMAVLMKYRQRFQSKKVCVVLTGMNNDQINPSKYLYWPKVSPMGRQY